jgi:pimeloyl-ACP methyl ester carboxylesterase
LLLAREMIRGEWRAKTRPEALIFGGRQLLKGWTVMDRLGEITVPTLVMAGRYDFLFPLSIKLLLRLGSPTRASRSSSALATIRTRSSPPRSWRPSATSSPQTHQ